MRDTTQIPQPIAPAPELISSYPEMPKKLASIDPDFRRYHEENDRRYKRIREAFAEAQTHLALPVTLVKLAQDRLDQAQVKLASELATANAKALAQAGTLLEVGTEIDAITGTLTSHATSINTLLSSIGGSGTDLSAITSRIDEMETTFAQADDGLQGSIDTWAQTTADLVSEVHNTTDGLPSAHSKIRTEELTRVDADNLLDGKIETGATRITALESSVDGVDGLIAKVTNIESTYATEAYAEAAASTAISTSLDGGGAIKTALDAAVVAGSGNKTYRQASAPASGMVAGDIWTDSDDGKLYRYSGSSWIDISDTRTAAIPAMSSAITSLQSTKVDAAGALAQANSAITASLGSGSTGTIGAAITTEQNVRAAADGFLSGKYTLAVTANANGSKVVTGMNVTSSSFAGDDISEVHFQADRFFITNATGDTSTIPFEVSGGVVRIKEAMIQSLSASKITAGTIAAMTIGTATLNSATISAGTITGTKFESYNPVTKTTATINGGYISGATLNGIAIESGTLSVTVGQIDALSVGITGYAPTTNVLTCNKQATFKGNVVIGRPQSDANYSKLQISSLEACYSPTLTYTDDSFAYPRVQILTASGYAKLIAHGTTATDKTVINAGRIDSALLVLTTRVQTPTIWSPEALFQVSPSDVTTIRGGVLNAVSITTSSLKFGTFTAASGLVSISGHITVTDSSGTSRKLACIL